MKTNATENNRFVWIKSGLQKVLFDSRWNEIVTEIGAVDEIIDYNDFQIVRRELKFGCVKGGKMIVPIKYDVITPSVNNKVLIVQNKIDGSDLFDNGIHILGKSGIWEIPNGKIISCDDTKESFLIHVDNKSGFYFDSTEFMSQIEYDEIISEPGFVIAKKVTDGGITNCELYSTILGWVIASGVVDYSIIDKEQVLLKNTNESWTLLRLTEKWDELCGEVKSYESVFDTPFWEFNKNNNGTFILKIDGLYYVCFPGIPSLSNPYERIVYCGNDMENKLPFVIGYKNGKLGIVSSLHFTRCDYDFISTPVSNHIIAISSCGGYEGRLKSICEIINLEKVYEEEGYKLVTDALGWKDYQRLYQDNKLTFEKYSKYDGGGIKSIRIPFLNDRIVQLYSYNQVGKKEILFKTCIEKVLGIQMYSAMDTHWKILGEMVEENMKKDVYDDEFKSFYTCDNFDINAEEL